MFVQLLISCLVFFFKEEPAFFLEHIYRNHPSVGRTPFGRGPCATSQDITSHHLGLPWLRSGVVQGVWSGLQTADPPSVSLWAHPGMLFGIRFRGSGRGRAGGGPGAGEAQPMVAASGRSRRDNRMPQPSPAQPRRGAPAGSESKALANAGIHLRGRAGPGRDHVTSCSGFPTADRELEFLVGRSAESFTARRVCRSAGG